ncbi:hypothetical protein [Flavobacterium frigidimaris]|uniref:hypothetical protein n=1 Tax=Flavobacterium frigidimaris TaxID=262320 RepID=UPI000F4D6C14|nr:hypothetical protein [Flavobacterium frigidimaris]
MLLIQCGFIIAQTKTVVTQYGEKLNISPYANNGLTASDGYIQLGGTLMKSSVLTTTSAYTLAIQGLQAGAATDNVLVSDANGVLKYVSRANFGGDNLGDHSATKDLLMNGKNINNAANITATGKTSTQTAQISQGLDGLAPGTGYVATSADNAGNIIWKPLANIPGSSSIAFFVQSSGKSSAGAPTSSPSAVPGLTNISYTAPATGKLILQLAAYTWLSYTSYQMSATLAFTNTQINLLSNGSTIATGMSTPMGSFNIGTNPECTTLLTRINVVKGTKYNFTVSISDFYNSANTPGSCGGTYSWEGNTCPSTLMGTLIPD